MASPVPAAGGTMVLKPGIISSNPDPNACIACSKDLKRAEGLKNRIFSPCCGSDCCLKCGAGDGKACPKCGTRFSETVADNVRVVKKHAKKGRVWAQYLIGNCFEYGTHMMQSHYEAVRWYRKSAREGHPIANLNLAYYYLAGIGGCDKDLTIAEDYLNRAIAIDVCVKGLYERRMLEISDVYREEGNANESRRILESLDNAGNITARFWLADAFLEVENDYFTAKKLFTSCAMEGHVLSAWNVAKICWNKTETFAQATVWRKFIKGNLHVLDTSTQLQVGDTVSEMYNRLRIIRGYCMTCSSSLNRSTRKLCSGCRTFCYCSVECQKIHWEREHGGHRNDCKAAQALVKVLKDIPACDSVRQVI